MSDADYQDNEPEGNTLAYAIALGSPWHFEEQASEDNQRTPRLARKEWRKRKCVVLTDGSDQKPPWICVGKCPDEDPLPVAGDSIMLYSNIKGTSDWKNRVTGNGDVVKVYFWRFDPPEGKKGKWNYFYDERESYHNMDPQPGQDGT